MNRRDFLKFNFNGEKPPVRPPGARLEPEFIETCTRCSDCLDACPEAIIIRGPGKFPEIDFSKGGCTFCNDCAAACPEGALISFHQGSFAWDLRAEIQPACLALASITCRVCGDACETEAIHFKSRPGGVTEPQVDLDTCTGCGECLSVCPAAAISITRKTQSSTNGDQPCQSSISVAC